MAATSASGLTLGSRVILHSINSRAELNGKSGVCYAYNEAKGRWAVVLDDVTLRLPGGGLLLKADNLIRTPDRADAARALCSMLSDRHPDKGFLVHAGVSFEEAAGEVSVRATKKMEKGEILLVVPESAMVAVSSSVCGAVPLAGAGARSMRELLDATRARFDTEFEDGLPVLEAHNVTLAVLLMHVACAPTDPLHVHIAATWPSLDATRAFLPVFWGARQRERLEGTALCEAVKALQEDAALAYTHVVHPLLASDDALAPLFTPPNGESLRDGFFHGLALALSRSHGDNRLRSSTSTVGKLAPYARAARTRRTHAPHARAARTRSTHAPHARAARMRRTTLPGMLIARPLKKVCVCVCAPSRV